MLSRTDRGEAWESSPSSGDDLRVNSYPSVTPMLSLTAVSRGPWKTGSETDRIA
jgi:hypothetical protein